MALAGVGLLAALVGMQFYFVLRFRRILNPALVGATKMFPAGLDTGIPPVPITVNRVGRPDEIADMAIAMLRNGYLTNKVITIDGGIVPRN